MIDRILKLSFYASVVILIFLLGYVSHKYKVKKVFQSVEPLISYFELKLDVDFQEKFGERFTNKFSNSSQSLNDVNFSINNSSFV